MIEQNQLPTNGGWWISCRGAPTGPHNGGYLSARLKTGTLSPQTLACPVGSQEWKKLCDWPVFTAICAASPQPEVVGGTALRPPPGAPNVPSTCPLCGMDKHMGDDAKVLYGHVVCRKCYYSFANRRQAAFAVDSLGWYCIVFLIAAFLGIPLAAAGSSPSEMEAAGNALTWLLLPVFFCKDCFSGQSLGKALFGVQVIDQGTGEPGAMVASFKRNVALVIPFMVLVVGFQLCKGHRIGDGWSHTTVIWKKYANHPIFAAKEGLESTPAR